MTRHLFSIALCTLTLLSLSFTASDAQPLSAVKSTTDCADICRNGGKLILTDDKITCECPPGLSGDRCQKHSSCSCLNGGLVKWNDVFSHCECPGRYFGKNFEAECPPDFTIVYADSNIKAGCYKLLLADRTWAAASAACVQASPKAHLAVVRNSEENERMNTFVSEKINPTCGLVWFGGQREKVEDCTTRFLWKPAGRAPFNMTFTDWHPGEPSGNCEQQQSGQGERQGCTQLWKSTVYKWDDFECSLPRCGAVCQVTD